MTMTPKQKNLIEYLNKGPEYELEIFKNLKGIEWFEFLYDQKYFTQEKNPKPIPSDKEGYFSIPYWPALQFLERTAKECEHTKNIEVAKKVMDVIRQISTADGAGSDNYHTGYSFVKILALLPTEAVTVDDIDLIRVWLRGRFDNSLVGGELGKSLLPKLLSSANREDRIKTLKIISIVTEIKKKDDADSSFDDWQLLVKPYWVAELFKRNSNQIGKNCGDEAIVILEDKLKAIYHDLDKAHDWSYIRRAAIEDHEQNLGEETAASVLVSAFRDILVSRTAQGGAENLLERLLIESDLKVFIRLALHAIAIHYSVYKNIFWKHYDSMCHNLFDDLNLHHEMHYFLKTAFEFFTPEERSGVISYINSLDSGADADSTKKSKREAYLRASWLYAIKDKGDATVDQLYKKYVDEIGREPEHPDFVNWHGSWNPKPSFDPALFNKILAPEEIVKYLNNFDTKNDFNEIAYDELGERLQARVKSEQAFFESILLELLSAKYVYHDFIIQGFKDLLGEGKPLNWDSLFEYFERLISEERLWAPESETKDRYDRRKWVPTTISQFIESGIRNDKNPIQIDSLPKVGNILSRILERQDPQKLEGEREDLLTWAINTPRGRTLESFIVYALNRCRLEKDNPEKKLVVWKEVEPVFDKEIALMDANGNFEFSALVGRYLPNFHFMSKEWVESKIACLFPNTRADKVMNWKAALDGYSYVNTVYVVIYDLLRRNGDLDKVVKEVHDHKRIRERMIDNIAVSYLRGEESLETSSLFRKVLDAWVSDDICDVISLFWSHREVDFKTDEVKRIFDFWAYCYTRCSGKERDNQEILSDINLLSVFFKSIDADQKKWLFQSLPYIEKRYHSTFVLEYFDKLADTNLKDVGELFLRMLSAALPTFHEENIVSIVTKLYVGQQTTLADDIYDLYSRAGHTFLKPVYEKFRRS